MESDRTGFLRTIFEQQQSGIQDTTPYRIYSDWLEENNHDQCGKLDRLIALIRLEHEMVGMYTWDLRFQVKFNLAERLKEQALWGGLNVGEWVDWNCGLVVAASVSINRDLKILEYCPLSLLHLTQVDRYALEKMQGVHHDFPLLKKLYISHIYDTFGRGGIRSETREVLKLRFGDVEIIEGFPTDSERQSRGLSSDEIPEVIEVE